MPISQTPSWYTGPNSGSGNSVQYWNPEWGQPPRGGGGGSSFGYQDQAAGDRAESQRLQGLMGGMQEPMMGFVAPQPQYMPPQMPPEWAMRRNPNDYTRWQQAMDRYNDQYQGQYDDWVNQMQGAYGDYQNDMDRYRRAMMNFGGQIGQLGGRAGVADTNAQQAAAMSQWQQGRPNNIGVGGSGDFMSMLREWMSNRPAGSP